MRNILTYTNELFAPFSLHKNETAFPSLYGVLHLFRRVELYTNNPSFYLALSDHSIYYIPNRDRAGYCYLYKKNVKGRYFWKHFVCGYIKIPKYTPTELW